MKPKETYTYVVEAERDLSASLLTNPHQIALLSTLPLYPLLLFWLLVYPLKLKVSTYRQMNIDKQLKPTNALEIKGFQDVLIVKKVLHNQQVKLPFLATLGVLDSHC